MTGERRRGTDARHDERSRMLNELERRRASISASRYAPWNPAAQFLRLSAQRNAPVLLKRSGVFPRTKDACLEIGFGNRGWIPQMLEWGLGCADIHGIEIDEALVEASREAFPGADLRLGDGAELPWPEETFHLVVLSTVLTSVLHEEVRSGLAHETTRVLKPGGAVLWYDFRVDNPSNPNVSGISRGEIKKLFPGFSRRIQTVTLAPPIARRIVPVSWTVATLLESLPFLRTHLLGVLVKPKDA